MKKNEVQNIIHHIGENTDIQLLNEKIGQFHAEVIERRLSQSNLTSVQKIAVINKLLQ